METLWVVWGFVVSVWKRFWPRFTGGALLIALLGLYERLAKQQVGWHTYVFVIALVLIAVLFQVGLEQHKRIMPRLRIGVLESSIWPYERYGMTGVGWHFRVENLSETEPLEDVRAEIVEIQPRLDYPPVPIPMKIKHEGYDVRTTTINPSPFVGQIDLLTGPSNDPRSQRTMFIIHGVRSELAPVQQGKYRIKVIVGAKNARSEEAWFEAWVGQDGGLKCVRL